MSKALRYSIVPATAALAALFMVLPQTGADRTVTMDAAGEGYAFAPAAVEVAVGSRVGFRNDSRVTHTATCNGCPWDTGDVQPGETMMVTFEEPIAVSFVCRYHGRFGMQGELRVGGAEPSPTPAPSPAPVPSG